MSSPMMLRPEVREVIPFSEPTLRREEKAGRFPRKVRISAGRVAYKREEVESWLRDPEGWAQRNSSRGNAA